MKALAKELEGFMRSTAPRPPGAERHPAGTRREYWQGWDAAAGFTQSFAAACDSPEVLASLLLDWATMLEAETMIRDSWTEGRRDAARAAATFVAGWLEGGKAEIPA